MFPKTLSLAQIVKEDSVPVEELPKESSSFGRTLNRRRCSGGYVTWGTIKSVCPGLLIEQSLFDEALLCLGQFL